MISRPTNAVRAATTAAKSVPCQKRPASTFQWIARLSACTALMWRRSSQVGVVRQPAHGEPAGDGWQVEGAQAVDDRDGERRRLGDADAREADHQPALDHADPA